MHNLISQNIWKLTLFNIFAGLLLFIPIVVLFFESRGLSQLDIMFLQSFFSILLVLFEIPSGYFADRYGRKKSLVIASIFGCLAIIIYSFSKNFYHLLLAEFFFAIKISFISGALSAMLYDSLLEVKQENLFKEKWGSLVFWGMAIAAVGSLLGGVLASYNIDYAVYATVPVFFLMIPVALMLQEPKREKIIISDTYLVDMWRVLKSTILKSKKLFWLLFYSALLLTFGISAFWLSQPYFLLTHVDVVYEAAHEKRRGQRFQRLSR